MTEIQARHYHNSAEGRQTFQKIITDSVQGLLKNSVTRNLLLTENYAAGRIPYYDIKDTVFVKNLDPFDFDISVKERVVVPIFEMYRVFAFSLLDNELWRKLANLHETVFTDFANIEITCFGKLLRRLVTRDDDISNLVNYHYAFCNTKTRQQSKTLQKLSSSICVFEIPNIEDTILLACKSKLDGRIPIRDFSCLAGDDSVNRSIGYSCFEQVGMMIKRQEVVKIVDKDLEDIMHTNKFHWMVQ
jgi:hypothetical protein